LKLAKYVTRLIFFFSLHGITIYHSVFLVPDVLQNSDGFQ